MLRKVLDRRLGPVHQKGNTRELQSVLWNLGTWPESENVSIFGTSRPREGGRRKLEIRKLVATQRSRPSPAFTEALRSPLHRSRCTRRVEQYSSGGSDARRGSSHQCRRCAAARHRAGKLSMLRRPERDAAHRLRSCVLFTSSNDPQTSPQPSAAPQTGRDQPISSFRVSSFQTRYSAMRMVPF